MLLTTGFILFAFFAFGKKQWDEIQSQSLFAQLEQSKNNQKDAIFKQPIQLDDWRPDDWKLETERSAVTGSNATLAGADEPKNARATGINVPYLVVQSTNTTPNDRLQQLTGDQNEESNDFPVLDNQTAPSAKSATSSRVGFYSLYSATPAPVQPQKNDQILIARDQPPLASPFLNERLQRVAIRDLSKLPTQDLMKLINHANSEISVQSETLLKKRDGFQEEHVQLARKLYHPDSSVRKSLLPQLADNDQLETFSWLSELLKDPEQEVRYATVKAIYSQIPLEEDELAHLKNIMQSDTDQRIAAVGQGLVVR